jgi:hypothetical protein
MAVEYPESGGTDGVVIGRATGKIGFYGLATPIVQRSSSTLATIAVTQSLASGFGFSTSALFDSFVAQVRFIKDTLIALNIAVSA